MTGHQLAPDTRDTRETLRLLMVRSAGVSFESDFNVRSSILESILNQHAEIGKRLESLRTRLLEDLHARVPLCLDRDKRGLLLRIKRTVFNCRPISPQELDQCEGELSQQLDEFNELIKKQQQLLDSNRLDLINELRSRLAGLVNNREFQIAVDYSCPWLLDEYRRHPPESEQDFSNEERSLYAYAAKFFSKANPFYTFASVGFPSATGLDLEDDLEVILNTSLILSLEQLLLPLVRDPYRRLISVCGFVQEDHRFRFLILKNEGARLISLKENLLLRQILEYFQQPCEYTFGGAVDYVLATASPSTDKTIVEDYLTLLIQKSIITEYLIKDLNHFAQYLLGLSDIHDELIRKLQRLHLARIPRTELPAVHEQLAALSLPTEAQKAASEESPYYINTYDRRDLSTHKAVARSVYEDLQAVKPFFTVSNFYDQSYVIKSFILDRVAGQSGAVPYLDLVCEFMRQPSQIVENYHPSTHRSGDERAASEAWLAHLVGCTGTLSASQISSLLSQQPRSESKGDDDLCFNGPFDYVKGVYYLANIFTGRGRFAARFLLNQGFRRYKPMACEDGWLDVQLAVPLKNNRSCVAAMFATGCGFERRYDYNFERWIDPSQIIVEAKDGRVVYRDSKSGQLLRLNYLGYVLAQYLPPHYKLLLADHADVYINPFEDIPQEPFEAEVVHTPALYYGSVCLRRQQWAFARSIFDVLRGEENILSCTVRLRKLVRKNTGCETDEWYIWATRPNKGSTRPRYLDLNNPLSVNLFRKSIAQVSDKAAIIFTPMEPPPQNLFRAEGRPFMTELMIEV